MSLKASKTLLAAACAFAIFFMSKVKRFPFPQNKTEQADSYTDRGEQTNAKWKGYVYVFTPNIYLIA